MPTARLGAVGDRLRMHRGLIVVGLVILALGLLWRWFGRLPLFRLPGDFVIDRPGFKVFFPFTTMLIISIALSLVAWLLRR